MLLSHKKNTVLKPGTMYINLANVMLSGRNQTQNASIVIPLTPGGWGPHIHRHRFGLSGAGRGRGPLFLNGCGVSVWRDEEVSEVGGGAGSTALECNECH